MKKLVITFIVILAAIASFFVSDYFNSNDYDGEITIIVVDQIGDTVSNEQYLFIEEDALFDILDDNYNIGCADSNYNLTSECAEISGITGRIILKIDDIETDWDNTYIAIYINGDYSTFGIDNIALHDGDVYRFEYKEVGDDN